MFGRFLCVCMVIICSAPLVPSLTHGATPIACDDFEGGSSWNYSSKWDSGDALADEWSICSNEKKSGSYCVQSKPPGDPVWAADSVFCKSLPTSGNEIFIRFWFKAGPNMNNCLFEFMRLTAVSGSDEIEIGTGYPCGTNCTAHCYSPSQGINVSNGWLNPTTATSWTEYAMYINYSQKRLIFWRNAQSYTESDASAVVIPFQFVNKYNRILLGAYYKQWNPSTGRTGSTFWMDDVEVWNGIPDQDSPPPPPSEEPLGKPGRPALVSQ
ncbi:MAG: hypothetical protein AB1640_24705 [bacterium]